MVFCAILRYSDVGDELLKTLRQLFSGRRGGFLKNTAALYILQFSSYFFSFLTVPYLTRVLDVEIYGMLGVATALMVYFQLFLDFGFLLYATAAISLRREDKAYISRLFTAITVAKLLFTAVAFGVLYGMCSLVDNYKGDFELYAFYLLYTCINAFIPDYIYRGLEQMKVITIRTVCIKFFFTVMIFVLVRSQSDYLLVPILTAIGNAGALVGVYVHMRRKVGVWFTHIHLHEILEVVKKSSVFFYSRIADAIYTASNTLILDFMDPTGVTVGFYTSADKIVTTAKNGLSPISDSLYPYMVKNRDFKLVKKTLCLLMPIIFVGCAVVFIFAETFCTVLFGQNYAGAAPVLRAVMPIIVLTLPNYILGFPTLGAMGLAKHANLSIVYATAVHVVLLVIMYWTIGFSMVSLGLLTSFTTFLIFLYRLIVVFKNRRLLLADGDAV
jgi:O-antigen/teichoic acid export membrane protein